MPWTLGGRAGTMTVFYTVEHDKPELRIQSVRDDEGEEIDVHGAQEAELMTQAKNFIGKE